MKRFVVLGGYGIIGRVVVADLFHSSKDLEIIVAGRNLEKAKQIAKSFKSSKVKSKQIDINDNKKLVELITGSDVVVNCLQYYFNLHIMKACIQAKTNYIDLGGLFHETKKQLKLNNSFKKIGKIAVLGCGSTPGITNVLAAHGGRFLDKIKSIEILFADKDETNYNQPFVLPYSFKTIVDEYTKNPAVFKNGKMKFVAPFSGDKSYNIPKYGKKKGFYTLHSELATFPESFKRKGVKNIEFRATFDDIFTGTIKDLIDLGFTSKENVMIKGKSLDIIDVTSSLMDNFIPSKNTKIEDSEILRVIFNKNELTMDAIIKSTHNVSAGVYDTAIPCSIISQMLSEVKESGVFPPERVIDSYKFFEELSKRKINVMKNGVPA